jgi:hypothetical protein
MKLKLNELRTEGENTRSIMAFVKVPSTKYKIYIPSKGRAKNCKTADILEQEGAAYQIVVEPQDYENYLKFYSKDKVMKIDKNDMGVGYVRQFIKDYATENKEDYFWMLDDDLKFRKRQDDKSIAYSAVELFSEAEEYIDKFENIGTAGLTNNVWAWVKKTDYVYNGMCVTCTIISTKTKARFRTKTVEDADFCLQVLTEGYCTVQFNRLNFIQSTPGTSEGGCFGDTHYNHLTTYMKNFIKEWGDSFSIKETKDGPRLKPSKIWKTFKQKLIKKQ